MIHELMIQESRQSLSAAAWRNSEKSKKHFQLKAFLWMSKEWKYLVSVECSAVLCHKEMRELGSSGARIG